MTDSKPVNPTELDAAQAAKKIEEANIADETAAYVNAGDMAAPSDDADASEAHPS